MRSLMVLLALVGFGMTGCGGADNTAPAPAPVDEPPAEGAPADPGATTPAPGTE